jgi:hypothetical protein
VTDLRPADVRQATVHAFDEATGSGSVVTDDGWVMPFSADAWRKNRIRTLRVGQRMRVVAGGEGTTAHVTSLTLVTMPLG